MGAGVGFGEAETIELGTVMGIGKPSNEASSIFTGGVNLNGTILFGGKGSSGSYQLIGANNGDWSVGGTGSTLKGLMANINISAHVQVNLSSLWNWRRKCKTRCYSGAQFLLLDGDGYMHLWR